MRARDALSWNLTLLSGHPLRSSLSMLGIAIGVAAVILLTSIGEGARRHILDQFTIFGTNLIAINPGRTETTGIPGVLGGTTRKLTLEDALALERVPGIELVVPHTHGQAPVQAEGRTRDVSVYGVTSDMPSAWKFEVASGSFLPAGDPRRGSPVAVLGPTVARELFGERDPLGRRLRIGDARFRVIGVLAPKGQMLGIDIDDSAWIPVASHMQLFNLEEVQEISASFSPGADPARVEEAIREVLMERHDDTEDFTITTQAQMLATFDKVMNVVTLSVAAIAGISLLVGAIGILTMMWISVGERTSEIGLLRAVGATGRQIQGLFVGESIGLAVLGGGAGVLVGFGLSRLLVLFVPGLPVSTPVPFAIAALGISALAGVGSGVLPARRAARLDPVEALRAE